MAGLEGGSWLSPGSVLGPLGFAFLLKNSHFAVWESPFGQSVGGGTSPAGRAKPWELKSSPGSSNPARLSPGSSNPALVAQIQPWRLKLSPGSSNPALGAQIQPWRLKSSLRSSNPTLQTQNPGLEAQTQPKSNPGTAHPALVVPERPKVSKSTRPRVGI